MSNNTVTVTHNGQSTIVAREVAERQIATLEKALAAKPNDLNRDRYLMIIAACRAALSN